MRWERLFADLDAQWAAEQRLERDAEVADRTRRERATLELEHRLAAARGTEVSLRLVSGPPVDGELEDLGLGWVLVRRVSGRVPVPDRLGLPAFPARSVLVPTAAVVALSGLPVRAADVARARRFGLGYVLRGLSRDRAVVTVRDTSGAEVTGTIDLVGADALDLVEHHADEPRREDNILGRRTVPFGALVTMEFLRTPASTG